MCKGGVICDAVAGLILRELVHGPLPLETLRLRMVPLHECALQSGPFTAFIRQMVLAGRINLDLVTLAASLPKQEGNND